MKIIYMGTPDFAVPALQALYEAGHEIQYVVTQPDAVRDRGKKVKFSPVKEKALELGIDVLQPIKIRGDEEFYEIMKNAQPDVAVVAAFGQILPQKVLDIPKAGCLNIHGSILPRFRGAAPIQAAIAAGDWETGVTIMKMAKGLDTGDMLTKAITPIEKKTGEMLHDELAEMGAKLIVETLEKLDEIEPVKQDDSLSTYAHMISKQDGHIDFTKSPEEIERLMRAFDPWPGTFAYIGEKMFKLWRAEAIEDGKARDVEPGTVVGTDTGAVDIACGQGILRVTQLQAPGKKRVATQEYLKGNSIEIGTVLR